MTQIRLRQDTATNWSSSSSIIPALGEPCIQTDGEKHFKIGDGTNKFNNLPYYVKSTELGDLDDLTTENKDTFVDAINEIVANGGDKDLSNLTTTGVNKLQAVKAYASYGEMLQDTDGLAFVEKYNKSTFDRSKFTVVGSPTITNNGIASGFSGSNYLTADTYDLTNAKTFKFKFSYKLGTYSWSCICGFGSKLYFERMRNNSVRLSWWENDTSHPLQSFTNIPQNVYCDYEIEVTNSNMLYCRWKPSGNNIWTQEVSLDVSSIRNIGTSLTLNIGKYGAGLPDRTGTADLKNISVIIDGVEVFSGNKTGIDTIKPDDYTVVGTPTITPDGIASGLDSSNYIQYTTADILSGKSWKIIQKVYWDGNTDPNYLKIADGYSFLRISIYKELVFNAYLASDDSQVWNAASASSVITGAGWYYIGVDFNYLTGAYSTLAGTTEENIQIINTVTKGSGEELRELDSIHYVHSEAGKSDLNSFKIYVDGNLVYQPCLKIPYTESKTGSKIVGVNYRERVNDMYKQFGYANYYTLQNEAKGNYTVVGSPTISSDFVASGFSSSNYVKTNNSNVSDYQNYEIDIPFNPSQINCMIAFKYGTIGLVSGNPSESHYGKIALFLGDGSTWNISSGSVSSQIGVTQLVAGTNYIAKIIRTPSQYILKLLNLDTGVETTEVTVDSTANLGNTSSIELGSDGMWADRAQKCTHDLKEFKIYVDNNLAYEAVTEPNFTLPQVELYGLIGQRTLRDSYRNGINYWELYSNRDLEQGGSCTSGVEVTFARPFADTNYVLSVPYSAKSTTAFTPTQTGDWIAKGKGVL